MLRYRLLALLLVAAPATAAIKTEEIVYRHGDLELQGYFAYDDKAAGTRPAVLVMHEWWGHGPYVRRRAEQLAALGYLAFAGDMYGKGRYAKTHQEAGNLAGVTRGNLTLMRARAGAGVEAMKRHRLADPARAAAIGYCFGGTTVLELARGGSDLKGVVSFHGSLGTADPEMTKAVKPKILVLHGADDVRVSPEVPSFQSEMRRAGADWEMVSYGGAVHSFTVREAGDDPSKGSAYNEAADRRSWRAMRSFLEEVLAR